MERGRQLVTAPVNVCLRSGNRCNQIPALFPKASAERVRIAMADLNCGLCRPRLLVPGRSKLLDAPSADGLPCEKIALGIQRERMQEREVAGHVAQMSETGNRLARLAVNRPDHLIESIGDVHVFL